MPYFDPAKEAAAQMRKEEKEFATEMLSLLERIVKDHNDCRDDKIGIGEYELAMRHNINDAKRLIAKAKGE